MARTKEQIEAAKRTLDASLTRIVDECRAITAEMKKLPHYRGVAHQSLHMRTGQYVLETENCLTMDYLGKDRKKYSIIIRTQ